jgi:hypothetical protein
MLPLAKQEFTPFSPHRVQDTKGFLVDLVQALHFWNKVNKQNCILKYENA